MAVQRPLSTRSSSVVTLARPSPSLSYLKITDRSIRYASPCLWNQPHLSLRQPHSGTISDSPVPSPITSFSSNSPLCSSSTPLFHSRLKIYLFHKSYPWQSAEGRTKTTGPPVVSLLPPADCLHGLLPGPYLLS